MPPRSAARRRLRHLFGVLVTLSGLVSTSLSGVALEDGFAASSASAARTGRLPAGILVPRQPGPCSAEAALPSQFLQVVTAHGTHVGVTKGPALVQGMDPHVVSASIAPATVALAPRSPRAPYDSLRSRTISLAQRMSREAMRALSRCRILSFRFFH